MGENVSKKRGNGKFYVYFEREEKKSFRRKGRVRKLRHRNFYVSPIYIDNKDVNGLFFQSG